ncbi:MAG: hypothetical protein ACP5TY_09905 [Thermodesulforhabdaceae bacterium]
MRILGIVLFTSLLLIGASFLYAQEPAGIDSKDTFVETKETTSQTWCDLSPIKEQISRQSTELSQEMRQIKREIALLRQSIEKPGLKEIFAGIGYILGLCGVAFYFSGKKKTGSDSGKG